MTDPKRDTCKRCNAELWLVPSFATGRIQRIDPELLQYGVWAIGRDGFCMNANGGPGYRSHMCVDLLPWDPPEVQRGGAA